MSIGFNVELALLVFCIFMLCIILLNKWLYQPLLSFMDARNAMIKKDLDNATGNNSEIDEINKQIEETLESARKEAAGLKEKAILEARVGYDEALQKARESYDKELADFKAQLEEQKQALKQSLMREMPSFQKSLQAKFRAMEGAK